MSFSCYNIPRNHSVRKTCRKTRGKYAEYARNVKHGTMSPNSVAVRAEHDVRIQHGMVPWKVRNVRSDKPRVSKIKALVLGTIMSLKNVQKNRICLSIDSV